MSTIPGRRMIEAATVIEQLDDDARLRRRLERDPGDHIAGTQLEAMYRDRGDWDGVIRVLLDRAEVQGPLEAARVLSDVADIYASRLDDVDAAMVVLQTAFAQSPDSARLADRLTDLAASTGRWEEVIDLFVVHAAKLSGKADAVSSELWLRVAWGHLAGPGDVEAAAAALERASDLQSSAAMVIVDHIESQATTPALLGLFADICRRLGDEDRLVRTLNRILSALEGADGSLEAHVEIARIQLARGDDETAEWHLIEAMRHDPGHPGASAMLMDLYKQRGEYLKAAKLLEVGCGVPANPLDQVQLSFEAAQIYESALDEQTMAVNLYESALKIDPEHVGAALPLALRYYREERWYELEPVIDMLVRRASALDDEAPPLHEILRMAGQTAARLGKVEKARRCFDSALNLKVDDLESLEGLGDILLQAGAWDEAAATLRAVLEVYDQRGDHESCVHILLELGRCGREMYDPETASQYFRHALRLEPTSSTAMAALSEIYREAGDLERAIEMMRAELRHTDDGRRVRLLAEIGRLTSRELRDPARAITIFQQALEIDPTDREVLHQLVEHYSAAGWWEDAVDAIIAITELEDVPLRRGKYLQAAAVILRTEVGDVHQSADLYDEALDCFYGQGEQLPEALRPSCMKAFSDLGRMLSEAGRWKRLEQSYRRMIRRIDPDDPVAADLWHGLGEIYRSHLGHRDSAIGSFEVASALDDKRLTRHRILVDLYESAGPEKAMEAITRRHRLLIDEPLVADHYKALRKLYARTKHYDRAWLACRALAYLGQADDEESAFLSARMPQGYDMPQQRMTPDVWRLVRDPEEDAHVTAIFRMVAEAAALMDAVPQKALGLDERVSGTAEFKNLVHAVAEVLDVSSPDVFVHPGSPGEILWANARRGRALARTIAIGRDLHSRRDPRYLITSIAKSLVYSRPAYFLRMAASSPHELEAIFLAASSLSRSDVPIPASQVGRVATYRKHFEAVLPRPVRTALSSAVDCYVAAGKPYDLVEWCRRVDSTARCAALAVSGDLELATAAGGAQVDDCEMASLLRHSVSDAHHTARVHLGLARD